jgi:hypothetical protein
VTAVIGLIQVSRQRGRLGGVKLALWGVGFPAAFYGPMALLIWDGSRMRISYRLQTTNHMKEIGLAFHSYLDEHKRLPPAAVCDAAGRPLLSWRVMLLPYLEQQKLFGEFKLDEPWNSDHNIKLLGRMPSVYTVDYRAAPKPHTTFFQVIVGPGTPFESGLIRQLPGSFPDGTSNTILVVDAAEAVPWTKPEDLIYDPGMPLPPIGANISVERFGLRELFGWGSLRKKGAMALLADASVRRIDNVGEETLRRAIVRNDGKELGPDW